MTDRIHFDDLTKITAPFGLLDGDTRARLKAWPHGWEVLNNFGAWEKIGEPAWFKVSTYRAIPAPLEKPSVDWSHVGPGINHFAAHENEVVVAFERMPNQKKDFWESSAGFVIARADLVFSSYRRGTVPWDQSLISRPGVKE